MSHDFRAFRARRRQRTGIDLMIPIGQLPPSLMNSRKIASLPDNACVTMHAAVAGMGIAAMPFFHVRQYVEAGLAESFSATSRWHRLPPTPCRPRACECRRVCGDSWISWPNGSRRRSSEETAALRPGHLAGRVGRVEAPMSTYRWEWKS